MEEEGVQQVAAAAPSTLQQSSAGFSLSVLHEENFLRPKLSSLLPLHVFEAVTVDTPEARKAEKLMELWGPQLTSLRDQLVSESRGAAAGRFHVVLQTRVEADLQEKRGHS